MSQSTKRKPIEQFNKVIELHLAGKRIFEIVQETGLSRSCINNWITRGRKIKKDIVEETNPIEYLTKLNKSLTNEELNSIYSFILGMYLGDGNIHIKNVATLSIALDKKYEKLNTNIEQSLVKLFNKECYIYDRSIDRGQKIVSNSISVKMSKKNLEIIFPQHGKGEKHKRLIKIEDWQDNVIVSSELVKGLIYSDGSYYYCKARKQFEYNFSNTSKDIVEILEKHLTLLGVKYNKNIKNKFDSKSKSTKYHINVVIPSEVDKLHSIIGDKNNPK